MVAATPPSASTLAAEARATSGKASGSDDPLASIPVVLASLSTPEAFAAAPKMLEARGSLREAEQLRIERELMTVLGGLATSCDTSSTLASYDALAAEEAASLSAERALVKQLLDAAGAEGRSLIWQVSDPGTLFVKSRAAQVATAGATLPAWSALQLEEKEELRVRRLLLGLQFAVEALSLDVEAQLASFAADVTAIDPAAADAADQTVAALERVDKSLLDAQRARFELLPGACTGLGDEAWLGMLERGFVRRYLGMLGGTGETGDRAVASSGGTKPTGGAMGAGAGMTTGGGQQMGASAGGQMGGGQQMGASTGGQMGGTQMGGASMGGQMGGQQMGGSTGGQQMGGSTGGQMGGQQMGGSTGGQMGGQQMGGSTGGQMGGQQMGGSTGGQQMGGSTGGQQMGGSTGGQMGGQQMGGSTGGQMGGGQQMGGSTGGQQMGGSTGATGGQRTGQGGTPPQR